MKKEQHAAVLFGLLTFEQSKQLFQWMDYEDKKTLIAIIAHAPYIEKDAAIEAVSECLDLITGNALTEQTTYKEQLCALADEKPKILARYITSLVRKTDSLRLH